MIEFLHPHAAKIATACIALSLYVAAAPSDISAEGRSTLAAQLKFAATYFGPADNGARTRTIRDVNPSLRHMDAWISSVGAGVALADIADSGRPADICLVDPRNDSVSVLPAPGTGARSPPFA